MKEEEYTGEYAFKLGFRNEKEMFKFFGFCYLAFIGGAAHVIGFMWVVAKVIL
jgi:hypothetical protein